MFTWLLTVAIAITSWPTPSLAVQPVIAEAKTEKSVSAYTLQIEQGTDFTALKKTADYIAQLIPLRVRIVQEGTTYIIRSGKSVQSDDFEDSVATLKSAGFSDIAILYIRTDQETIATVVNPESPEQSSPLPVTSKLPVATSRISKILPADIEISRLQRLKNELDQQAQNETGTVIQRAWKAYQHGSMVIACGLFQSALATPETEQEASRGLALCLLQRGEYDKAITLLTGLLQKGVKPEESRALLVEALFKVGQYDAALKEAQFLEKTQAQQWERAIATKQSDAKFAQAWKDYDPKQPEIFVTQYRPYLEQCLLPDIFLTAAQDLLAKKNPAAGPLFEGLYTACDERWDIKLSAYRGLKKTLSPDKIRPWIDRELARKNLPPTYRVTLMAEKTDLLRQMASSSPVQAEMLHREILSLNPQDKSAQLFLAWHYFNHTDYSAALNYFRSLYQRYPHEQGITDGLAYTLAHLGKLDEALELTVHAGNRKLQADFLREKLGKTPPESRDVPDLGQQLLALNPNDTAALSALAWWSYQHGNYSRSTELFKKLSLISPESSDYRSGLIYSLSKQNQLDEAIDQLKHIKTHDENYRKLGQSLYMTRANRYFQDKNYTKAQPDLYKVLELAPKDSDARLLLGWSLFFQQKNKAALEYFLGIWQERQDTGVASVLPGLFDALGKEQEKAAFFRQLEQSKKPELRKTLGDYYASQNWNIMAAQTSDSPQSPYLNAHRPSLSVAYLNREKSGDDGTSQLEQHGSRHAYKYPLDQGRSISFELTQEHLSSGNVNNVLIPLNNNQNFHVVTKGIYSTEEILGLLNKNDLPSIKAALDSVLPIGTVAGLSSQSMQRPLITSADLVTPVLKYQVEGKIKQSYTLGATPLNGTIEPMVTASAQLEQQSWQANIHQEPIAQSILSYVGLNDPFSSKSWGRVLRSGMNGNYTFALGHDYWLSLSGRTDYYWGKNVVDNFGAEGGVSAGKSIKLDPGSLTLGVFVSNMHFERNVNFYTYGNGGYFSPNYLIAAGPFVNFEHKSGQKLWWKTELSTNWFHSQSSAAAVFPLQTGYLREFEFAGSIKEGIGYRVGLEGRYLLNPYLDIGGRFSMEQSASFSDMNSSIGIRMYFSPRNSIVENSN